MSECKYGDPTCPCQDGDMCHYEGDNPMLVRPEHVRRALSRASDWRDISTAPRDVGILMWRLSWRYPLSGSIDEWGAHEDDEGMQYEPQPTHWMPLPPPPEQGDT